MICDICSQHSLHRYDAFPHVIDRLEENLTSFLSYTGWLVQVGAHVWALWSPNSTHLPFYPGKQDPEYSLAIKLTSHDWQCDGHLGWFNYTISPQISGFVWRSFVMRMLPEYSTVKQYPEFETVHSVWISDPPPALCTGMLPLNYVKALSV
ncbi:hypothetical protein L208DRAFT_1282298 [Tricholoma matsutake]|nr:hypothetical protein L208DRAFT_1282298 [Tricholoma matsutake 945]